MSKFWGIFSFGLWLMLKCVIRTTGFFVSLPDLTWPSRITLWRKIVELQIMKKVQFLWLKENRKMNKSKKSSWNIWKTSPEIARHTTNKHWRKLMLLLKNICKEIMKIKKWDLLTVFLNCTTQRKDCENKRRNNIWRPD